MGLFDFLRKSTPPPGGGAPLDRKVAGPARVVGDKRAQTYDRLEAIQTLAAMKTPEAAGALLKRFSFSIDPSITDQEEKDIAYQGILEAGADVVPAVREYCIKAEVLTWPLKVLRELLDDEQYKEELLDVLAQFDTEYTRNVEPKLAVIMALESVVGDDVREAVEPFLEDVNETIRFHAIETTFAQNNAASVESLVKLLEEEESVRVKNKVAEGLIQRGWALPAALREAAKAAFSDTFTYSVSDSGKVVKVG